MKRIKASVIGLGFIGVAHVDALKRLPGVDVIAAVDACGIDEKAAMLDVPNAFSDYREMIEVCKPDCIHICTPNYLHREIAIYALERGIHVVCEKPMAMDSEEARKMVAAAKRSGLVNAVNFHNRFYPVNHQLKTMIQNGELGKIQNIHGVYLQDCFLKDTDFNWRMLSQNGGRTRVISDIGSHWIDLAEYVIGQKVTEVFAEFQRTYATRKRKTGDAYEEMAIDTEDNAFLMFRFSGGAIGSMAVSQLTPGKKNQTAYTVAGTKMSAAWDSEQISDLWLGLRDEPNRVLTKDPALLDAETAAITAYPGGHVEGFPDAFRQNFTAIYKAIRGEASSNRFATFEDGLHQMEICDKLFESAQKGAWLKLSE